MNTLLINTAIIMAIAAFIGSLTAIGTAFANLINARAHQLVTNAELARQQQRLADVAAAQTAMQVAQATQPAPPLVVALPAPAPAPAPAPPPDPGPPGATP